MGAADIVFRLAAAGFRLRARGDDLMVTPASMLTEDIRTELRQAKPELLALLKTRTCRDCRHLSRVSTCLEPVQAGLRTESEGFGIAWPPAGYGAACRAWSRSPADAVVAVLTVASREGWSDEQMHTWLQAADEDPDATLQVMRSGGPTP